MPNFVEAIREMINPELRHGQEIYRAAKKLLQYKSQTQEVEYCYTSNSVETRIAHLIPISENPYGFREIKISKLLDVNVCELDPPMSRASKKRIIENDRLLIEIINKDEKCNFFIKIDKNGNGPKTKQQIKNLDKFLAIANQLLNQKHA